MNDTQMNWLRMFRKVKGVFTDNSAITGTYQPIGLSFTTFNDLLGEIEVVSAADSRTTTGSYEDKVNKKETMALEASEMASAASAYAKDQGDTELLAVLGISYSEIRYSDEQSSYSLAMTVYNELSTLGSVLEAYMIAVEDLTALKASIDAYHTTLENTGGQDSVARTRQLAGLFGKANDHLRDHLDKLMTRIKRKEPVFFDTYTNARVIIDLGGGRKQEASSEASLG